MSRDINILHIVYSDSYIAVMAGILVTYVCMSICLFVCLFVYLTLLYNHIMIAMQKRISTRVYGAMMMSVGRGYWAWLD